MEEHRPTLGRPATAQVEEILVGPQPTGGRVINRRGVDDEVRPVNCFPHAIQIDRPAGRNAEISAQTSGLLEIARDHPDLVRPRLKRGRNRSRGSARPDDSDTATPTRTPQTLASH